MGKILIVDDTEMMHLLFNLQLNTFDVIVDNAYNGMEAIELVKDNDYDIILMDMSMPFMNGNETTIKIKESKPDIPVYSITAFDRENVNEELYKGHFQKPINFKKLSKTLMEIGIKEK